MSVWRQIKYRCDSCGTVTVVPESAIPESVDAKPGAWIRLEMPDHVPYPRRRDLCSWRCMQELANRFAGEDIQK